MDYFSSYPEAIRLTSVDSRTIITALLEVFARFGFPKEVLSDNGGQFISKKTEAFFECCGFKHYKSSPHYSRCNGKIERFHRYLKKCLRAAVSE